MNTSDWINLLVPILSNFIISSFVVVIINKKIERRYEKSEKQTQCAFSLMNDIKNHLDLLKMQIIKMQCQLGDSAEERFKQLFMIGGDFQVCLNDYREYIVEKQKQELFCLDELDAIVKEMIKVGTYMKLSNTKPEAAELFAESLENTLQLCRKVIQKYNVSLSDK